MSFIRSGSNPEGLYIWSDGGSIFWAGHTTVTIRLTDWGHWKRVLRKYKHADFNGARFKVEHDVTVTPNNKEIDITNWSARRIMRHKFHHKVKVSILFQAKWHHFYLWEVTYRAIVNNALAR